MEVFKYLSLDFYPGNCNYTKINLVGESIKGTKAIYLLSLTKILVLKPLTNFKFVRLYINIDLNLYFYPRDYTKISPAVKSIKGTKTIYLLSLQKILVLNL